MNFSIRQWILPISSSNCVVGVISYSSHFSYISEIFSIKKICPLPTFIHSIIYISMDSWIFYSWDYNPILLLFMLLLRVFQFWALSLLAPVYCGRATILLKKRKTIYFLTLHDTPGSSCCIFSALAPITTHFSKELLENLIRKMTFRN